ncbi:MAG TPA: UPF0149 family protein, partial [Gammaproteobacteria bacterium]|nr:UPF0149 family protein [Gammaproteobacteria bacterium]
DRVPRKKRLPPDTDEGVLDISELDGFLTAVVSGPVTLPPSRWIPAIWGDFEPKWQTDEEAEAVFTLIVRHMNGIVLQLVDSPDDFEPMFLENTADGGSVLVVDEWCEGYRRGMALSGKAWDTAPPEIVDLLMPILGFTGVTNWAAQDEDPSETNRNVSHSLDGGRPPAPETTH